MHTHRELTAPGQASHTDRHTTQGGLGETARREGVVAAGGPVEGMSLDPGGQTGVAGEKGTPGWETRCCVHPGACIART